jgi:hypothetical protein
VIPTRPGLFPSLTPYMKALIGIVGILLLPLLAGTVDRDLDAAIRAGKAKFDAIRTNRGEFYAFFLFSLTGLMLCASADDLIWLFLALELTSLPTYIMVTISTRGTRSQEAGVKYFFLGALGAAVFLYGFALLYGACGLDRPRSRSRVAFRGPGRRRRRRAQPDRDRGSRGVDHRALLQDRRRADALLRGGRVPGRRVGVSAFLAFVPKAAGSSRS